MNTHSPSLPGWLPAANKIIVRLQKLGLTMDTIHVLTVPGRVSGEPRPTPVSPLTVDGIRYVIAGDPGSDWARNVRATGHGVLSRGRRRERVLLIEVHDPERKRAVMAAFPREVPHGVPMFVRMGIVAQPDPQHFAEASDKVAVFEIRPVSAS